MNDEGGEIDDVGGCEGRRVHGRQYRLAAQRPRDEVGAGPHCEADGETKEIFVRVIRGLGLGCGGGAAGGGARLLL